MLKYVLLSSAACLCSNKTDNCVLLVACKYQIRSVSVKNTRINYILCFCSVSIYPKIFYLFYLLNHIGEQEVYTQSKNLTITN